MGVETRAGDARDARREGGERRRRKMSGRGTGGLCILIRGFVLNKRNKKEKKIEKIGSFLSILRIKKDK